MTENESELRQYIARLEGAAKRLLDAIGAPADNKDGADAVIKALRSAADKRKDAKPWEF